MVTARPVTELARAARVFHALSDPTRLEVVALLRKGERCVCELTEALGAAQSRLSFHLKVLKEAGVVTDRREGRWVYYALDRGLVEGLADLLADCCSGQRTWLKGGCCG